LGAREVLTTCCWSWCGVGVNGLLVKVSNWFGNDWVLRLSVSGWGILIGWNWLFIIWLWSGCVC
jgi:hypothetical protein